MVDEHLHALVFEQSDDRCPEEHHLLVVVGDSLIDDALPEVLLLVVREEAEQQTFRLVIGEQFQFVGILDIHDFITDVVSRLHEEHERVACPSLMPVAHRHQWNFEFIGYLLIVFVLGSEEAELVFRGEQRGMRIFHDAGERRVGHDKASGTPPLETVGQQPESVGVSVKARDVCPEERTDLTLQMLSRSILEIGLYGFFARMSERRIPEVVCETRRRHDGSYLLEECVAQFRVLFCQQPSHIVSQRHADGCHFKAVRQAVVHEDASR